MPGTGVKFRVAAERLPMLKTVYPSGVVEPPLTPPEKESQREWERADAIRELVRGRLEVSGPTTATALASTLVLAATEIDAALIALEGEGFVLRGRFHPGTEDQEWCDRRLLARIHRLTINRLRAEIQPVTLTEFHRFLAAWQRLDAEHRAQGPEGLATVLELFDGYELPAGAWEPDVLAGRVHGYDPQWLDRASLTGCIGWGRLSAPQNLKARMFSPVRSSPISIFQREHLSAWLELSSATTPAELTPNAQRVLEVLTQSGALFFGELVRRTNLLPSLVEHSLSELAASGLVTADSFDGLRALLIPSEKRPSLIHSVATPTAAGRRRKSATSVEFAGRWSLLREPHGEEERISRETAIEVFARSLLGRYGVVFRRLLERESWSISWYDLGRVYRRLEARGEIRGGHFVSGVSGEQFALAEAIGLMRSLRKAPAKGELIAISAADPLNLAGILAPGPRVTAIAANRVLLRDGLPIAALEAGQIHSLDSSASEPERVIERALKVGTLPAALRACYA